MKAVLPMKQSHIYYCTEIVYMNLLLRKLTAQILINRGTCIPSYITHKTP